MVHVEREEKISKFWEENNIFDKSINNRPKDKTYVFFDGPPFATGLPHYGHILSLTSKDLFPRYWTMKGYRVERKWGWDCHGLPIENIAEKELGIKKKKEIEEMGVTKFNEFCRSKVLFFADEWKKTVDRMGKWINFEDSYKTMDNTYMESVWHIFKKFYDDDYIYEGKKVLLYCPRCETPLSNFEISMDNSYKTVTEKSAVGKFKLLNQENTYLLAWTTTPWTLIGNVAIAVNEQLNYVKIKFNNDYLILAKNRLEEVNGEYKIIEEFKGKNLIGLDYEPLFKIESDKKGHYVINGGNEVSADEGTGMVHMALYGEFDYQMVRKYDLPVIQHIDEHGIVKDGPDYIKGTWFKKADALVLEDLENRNLLFKADEFTHPYPFCYRCDTPLFYNAVDSWFVDITKAKKLLIEKNQEINWVPDHLKEGRFKHILETAPDWSISRNRFWATSIPVWKCDSESCNHIEVIGSVKELQEKAIEDVKDGLDLHKHIVDDIHLKCSKCESNMSRIPEVLDCWFESGSMPYGQKHYPFENKDWFNSNFPADFISEYIGQVRAWFYYMHVVGVLLMGKAPFKNCVVNGNILAADGAKMSKSKKNYPDPMLIFDKYGADTLRLYLMISPLMRAKDLNFNEESVKDLYRKFNVILGNVKRFYGLFGQDNQLVTNNKSEHILDKWIISKLNLLNKNVTNFMDDYDTVGACNELVNFVDELSTWYVRRSRDRFKDNNEIVKNNAIQTLAHVLHNFSKMIAPVTPFIAEDIHSAFSLCNLKESVHLEDWPIFDNDKIHKNIMENMQIVRDIVRIALDERDNKKIPIRQVLNKLTVYNVKLDEEYLDLIKDELNVKSVELGKGNDEKITEISIVLDIEITRELLLEGISRDLIRKINNYRRQLNLSINDRIDFFIETESKDVLESIEMMKDSIMHQIQADNLNFKIGNLPEDATIKEIKVNKEDVKMFVVVK